MYALVFWIGKGNKSVIEKKRLPENATIGETYGIMCDGKSFEGKIVAYGEDRKYLDCLDISMKGELLGPKKPKKLKKGRSKKDDALKELDQKILDDISQPQELSTPVANEAQKMEKQPKKGQREKEDTMKEFEEERPKKEMPEQNKRTKTKKSRPGKEDTMKDFDEDALEIISQKKELSTPTEIQDQKKGKGSKKGRHEKKEDTLSEFDEKSVGVILHAKVSSLPIDVQNVDIQEQNKRKKSKKRLGEKEDTMRDFDKDALEIISQTKESSTPTEIQDQKKEKGLKKGRHEKKEDTLSEFDKKSAGVILHAKVPSSPIDVQNIDIQEQNKRKKSKKRLGEKEDTMRDFDEEALEVDSRVKESSEPIEILFNKKGKESKKGRPGKKEDTLREFDKKPVGAIPHARVSSSPIEIQEKKKKKSKTNRSAEKEDTVRDFDEETGVEMFSHGKKLNTQIEFHVQNGKDMSEPMEDILANESDAEYAKSDEESFYLHESSSKSFLEVARSPTSTITLEADNVLAINANKPLTLSSAMKSSVEELPGHRKRKRSCSPQITIAQIEPTLNKTIKLLEDYVPSTMSTQIVPILIKITKLLKDYVPSTISSPIISPPKKDKKHHSFIGVDRSDNAKRQRNNNRSPSPKAGCSWWQDRDSSLSSPSTGNRHDYKKHHRHSATLRRSRDRSSTPDKKVIRGSGHCRYRTSPERRRGFSSKKVELVRGSEILISQNFLEDRILKVKYRPSEMVRRLMLELVGKKELTQMTARGTKDMRGVPRDILKAVYEYVCRKGAHLSETQYIRIINQQCGTLRQTENNLQDSDRGNDPTSRSDSGAE